MRRFLGWSAENAQTSGYHLWFLPAMVWAFLLLGLSSRLFRSTIPALVAGVILYMVSGLLSFPEKSLPGSLVLHEGLNLSLIFVGLGFWYGNRVKTTGKMILLRPWMVLCSLVLFFAEAWIMSLAAGFSWFVPTFFFGRILVPLQLLLLAASTSNWEMPSWLDWVSGVLASASTGIYLLHVAILELIPFKQIIANGFVRDNLVQWSTAVIIPVLISLTVVQRGPKWVKSLFS